MHEETSRWKSARVLWGALRAAVFSNMGLKLVSLGIALVLWFVVSSERALREVTLFDVPLHIRLSRSDLLVTGLAYRVVDVRVRGPARQVIRLKPSDLSVLVDVSHLAPGSHILTLDTSFVQRPAGIEVLRIDPPRLPVELQRIIAREVPIAPRFAEDPRAWNYVVVGYEVKPERARVTGPEGLVAKLEQIRTHAISLQGVNSSLTLTAPLDLKGLESVRISPREVAVTVFVEEVAERRFLRLPIVVRAPRRRGQGIEIVPSALNVIVRGPRSFVAALREHDILVEIPEEALRPSPFQPGELEVAPQVRFRTHGQGQTHALVLRLEPERVKVRWRVPQGRAREQRR